MRLILLLLTLMFSLSVVADCCNYEIDTPNLEVSVSSDHQNCDDNEEHSEKQDCHCSTVNHFKIISNKKLVLAAPISTENSLISSKKSLIISQFESLIFHPPIV